MSDVNVKARKHVTFSELLQNIKSPLVQKPMGRPRGHGISVTGLPWYTKNKSHKNKAPPSRCALLRMEHPAQLHIFCDASELAYGAVTYLKVSGRVSFLTSKSRPAPMKFLSNPKLELCAAVLAVQLLLTVKQELPVKTSPVLWSDSQTILRYICNTITRKKLFLHGSTMFACQN